MTKFTDIQIGKVGAPDGSPTNAATIDASGTATFTQTNFSGALAITGGVTASSSAVFSERIQVGGTGQRGTVEVTQRTTVIHTNTASNPKTIKLPSGSDVTDIHFQVEEPFITAAGATAANIAVSAAAGSNLVSFSVSASTVFYGLQRANAIMGIANAYRNVTATLESHVSIQGSNTALSAGQGILTVKYMVP